MRILHACSSNLGKLAEFSQAAENCTIGRFQIIPLPGLKKIAPPEEPGATFEENAVWKALYYSRFSDEVVFADDSGLEVKALGGAPGIRSARFAGPAATDAENNALLLREMRHAPTRAARFVTAIAAAQADRLIVVTQGSAAGSILEEPRGTGGFGYDPLFLDRRLNKSFAELSGDEKFSVSARGSAFRSLLERLAISIR